MDESERRTLEEVCRRYGLLIVELSGVDLSALSGRTMLAPESPSSDEGLDWSTCVLYLTRRSTYFNAMHEVAHLVWHEEPYNTNEAMLIGLETGLHEQAGTYVGYLAWLKEIELDLVQVETALQPATWARVCDRAGLLHPVDLGGLGGDLLATVSQDLKKHVEALGYSFDPNCPEPVHKEVRQKRQAAVADLLARWADQICLDQDNYLYQPGESNPDSPQGDA